MDFFPAFMSSKGSRAYTDSPETPYTTESQAFEQGPNPIALAVSDVPANPLLEVPRTQRSCSILP